MIALLLALAALVSQVHTPPPSFTALFTTGHPAGTVWEWRCSLDDDETCYAGMRRGLLVTGP